MSEKEVYKEPDWEDVSDEELTKAVKEFESEDSTDDLEDE